MSDKQLERLLRMAGEIDDLADRATPPRAAGAWGAKRAWLHVGAGIAAAVLVSTMLPTAPRGPGTSSPAVEAIGSMVPVSVCYSPGAPTDGGARIETFQPVCEIGCALLAIFREWNDECQCLAWTVHHWADGTPVADLAPGQPVDIPLNVSDDPPVEQVLVLAVATSREALTMSGDHADELLACLNETSLSPGPERDLSSYTSAVERCLPEGVTILPQSFVIGSR